MLRWFARLKTVTHPSTSRDGRESNSRPSSRKFNALITRLPSHVTQLMRRVAGDVISRASSSSSSSSGSSSDGRRRRRRRKRSHSVERHVEVLVAVDEEMRRYHGHNLEHYILTLMAIVNTHTPTLYSSQLDTVYTIQPVVQPAVSCKRGFRQTRSIAHVTRPDPIQN